jgi:pimeloyl-ACP methyl ester carboxylesterase
MSETPTVVLVHGAFADGSSWNPVTRELLDRGHRVRVIAGYNRGLLSDAASVRTFVEQIDGPVVLGGHSYGGAVISIAGLAENVRALVYVAGYVPDEGETIGELQGRFPASPLAPALLFNPNGEGGTDASVDVDQFPDIFAIGVDRSVAEVLAVSQRPLDTRVFDEVVPAPAWKTTPGWGIVPSADRTINPDVERFGYQRAGLRGVTELDAPHLVMHTHPREVADVIETALKATA